MTLIELPNCEGAIRADAIRSIRCVLDEPYPRVIIDTFENDGMFVLKCETEDAARILNVALIRAVNLELQTGGYRPWDRSGFDE